ncbi:6683_t:CDS:10 [Ambispora gerdemannii]|uniref:6683_t:CDS:1 n=1 Tax=Ambispora gerdemannii TaxID=144530 RepID=A0A9N9AE29_9GLOM|nr:6683_t:CDS:10 [Ambispora gerdemannii]
MSNSHEDAKRMSAGKESMIRNSVLSYAIDSDREPIKKRLSNQLYDYNDASLWYKRKRTWLLCGGILLIILAVLLPLILFVIFPVSVQRAIDHSNTTFHSLIIAPAGEQKFHLNVSGSVSNAGSYKAVVSYPEPAEVLWNDTKIGTIGLPDISINEGGSGELKNVGDLMISDPYAFANFVKTQLTEETFTWNIRAKMSVKIMGITKKGLPFEKAVTLKGANGFKDTNLTSFNITRNPNDNTTYQQISSISLYNPSQIGIHVGTLGLNIGINNVSMGSVNSTDKNLIIYPGYNNINFSGIVTKKNKQELPYISKFVQDFTNNIKVPVIATGAFALPNSTYGNDWLSEGVKALAFEVGVQRYNSDVPSSLIHTVSIPKTSITFGNDWAPILSAEKVTANYQFPFDTPIKVFQAKQSISLWYNNVALAGFESPWAQASNDEKNIYLSIPQSPITIFDGQQENFGKFISALSLDDNVPFELRGNTGVRAKTTIGNIEMQGFDFKAVSKLKDILGHKEILAGEGSKSFKASLPKPAETRLGLGLNITPRGIITSADDTLRSTISSAAPPFIQAIIDASKMSIDSILLTDLSDTKFNSVVKGALTNTGPANATIYFPKGVVVSSNGQELGILQMPPVQASNGQASINSTNLFTVTNQDALEQFTEQLLGTPSAQWELSATGLVVFVLGKNFTGLTMKKTVPLKGSNGFKGGVQILYFNLPGIAPEGGIEMDIMISLFNGGTVGVDAGTLSFKTVFEGVEVGPASASNAVIQPKEKNTLGLKGRITPKTDPHDITVISKLFGLFVTGTPITLQTVGAGVKPSSGSCKWLSKAITKLSIDVVLHPPPNLKLITSVDLKALDLAFTTETAYAPLTSSNNIVAGFFNPFGFPLDILKIEQSIDVFNKNADMAKLVVPLNPAKTNQKDKTVTTRFNNVPFAVNGGQKNNFNDFVKDITLNESKKFQLKGKLNAITKTPAGTFNISGITYDVQTTLAGLQGFTSNPVSVSDLDVVSGTTTTLFLSIKTSLFNPSNISIKAGDVSFSFSAYDAALGTVKIKALNVVPKENSLKAVVNFSPKASDKLVALKVLSTFLQGDDQVVNITGSESSTPIESLKEAFAGIKLNTKFPGNKKPLIISTSLSPDANTFTTGIANGTVTISNPFSAPITLFSINSNITFKGIQIGSINIPQLPKPITIPGKAVNFTTDPIPIKLNLDPATILEIISSISPNSTDFGNTISSLIHNNGSTPLNIGDIISPLIPNSNDIQSNIGDIISSIRNGNIPLKARDLIPNGDNSTNAIPPSSFLNVDIALSSEAAIDQFKTPLIFSQKDVPVDLNIVGDILDLNIVSDILDNNIFRDILDVIGSLLIQPIVDGSDLVTTRVAITKIRASSFVAQIKGTITKTGPIDATISFPNGLQVTAQGVALGRIFLPPVSAVANKGGVIDSDAAFQIDDIAKFAEFTGFLLQTKEFTWDLSADDVQVTTLGLTFNGIKIHKSITLDGFNGLKDVKPLGFKIVGPSPDGKGLLISLSADMVDSADIGIELGNIGFNMLASGVVLGPVNADGVTLVAKSDNVIPFKGEIVQSPGVTKILPLLLSALTTGLPLQVQVVGTSVKPPGTKEPVLWLEEPFKKLVLNLTLNLPASNQTGSIVKEITINDLDLSFTPETAFSPLASSSGIVSKVDLSFGIPITLEKVAQNITIIDGKNPVASFKLPFSTPKITKDGIVTSFSNQRLTSENSQQVAFEQFIGELTLAKEKDLSFQGTLDILAKTPLGELPMNGVPFSASTSLKGLQGLKSAPVTVSNISVHGGTKSFLDLGATVSITNPSNVKVGTGDVAFDIFFGKSKIGQTILKNLVLDRGLNTIPAQFQYAPIGDDAINDGANLLGNFLENKISDLEIRGNSATTSIKSLQPTFSKLSLSSTLNGIDSPLIRAITVKVNSTAKTATTSFTMVNPLDAPFGLIAIHAKSFLAGKDELVGTLDIELPQPGLPIPSRKPITSPDIPFTIVMDPAKLIPIIIANKGKLPIDMKLTTNVLIGEYLTTINYFQGNLTAVVTIS